MKQFLIIIMVSFIINECNGQTFTDKQLIYSSIIDSFIDKQVPIINQTVIGYAKYDLDGDYEKWLYNRGSKSSKDSLMGRRHICGNPIKYCPTVTTFIASRGFDVDTSFFYEQVEKKGLDSLSKYITGRELTDCKYRPTPTSYFWNLFYKKRKAVALSRIIFNKAGNIAVIKMQYFSKSDMHKDNPSQILVYHKNGLIWSLLGIIDESPL